MKNLLFAIGSVISLCGTILIDLLLENIPAFLYAANATKWLIRGLFFCGFLMGSLIVGIKRKNKFCTITETIRIGVCMFLTGGLVLPVFTLLPTKVFVELFALFRIRIHPFFSIVLFTIIIIVLISVYLGKNNKSEENE